MKAKKTTKKTGVNAVAKKVNISSNFLIILAAAAIILSGAVWFLIKLNDQRSQTEDSLVTMPQAQEAAQNQKSLPTDFPADFPVYKNASFKEAWTSGGTDSEGISVIWETKDLVEEVADYYTDELPQKGWQVSSSFSNAGSFVISFTKEKVSGFVGISRNEKTIISVTLGW